MSRCWDCCCSVRRITWFRISLFLCCTARRLGVGCLGWILSCGL